jgi:hypothetical protein
MLGKCEIGMALGAGRSMNWEWLIEATNRDYYQ